MPRTDEQIYEYMEYYNGTPYRREALSLLAAAENKTPAEIREICEKFKKEGTSEMGKYSDKLKSEIVAERTSGMSIDDICDKHHLTKPQIYGILSQNRNKESGNETEAASDPDIETDVKTYLPKQCDHSIAETENSRSVWFALCDALKDFAENILGAGTKVCAMYYNDRTREANIEAITPDDKLIRFTVEEYKNDTLHYRTDER